MRRNMRDMHYNRKHSCLSCSSSLYTVYGMYRRHAGSMSEGEHAACKDQELTPIGNASEGGCRQA